MEDIRLEKLKTRLYDVINKWVESEIPDPDWDALDTWISDYTVEYMTEAAFNVLMAQSDLVAYLKNDGQLDS